MQQSVQGPCVCSERVLESSRKFPDAHLVILHWQLPLRAVVRQQGPPAACRKLASWSSASISSLPHRSLEPAESVAGRLCGSQTVLAAASRVPVSPGADAGQGLDPQGPGCQRGLQEPGSRPGGQDQGLHWDHRPPPGRQCWARPCSLAIGCPWDPPVHRGTRGCRPHQATEGRCVAHPAFPAMGFIVNSGEGS